MFDDSSRKVQVETKLLKTFLTTCAVKKRYVWMCTVVGRGKYQRLMKSLANKILKEILPVLYYKYVPFFRIQKVIYYE